MRLLVLGDSLMSRLVYRDNDGKRGYEDDAEPGVIRYEYDSPLAVLADEAIDGLKTIRDSTGDLTATELSDAVRLLASVGVALARLRLGHTETD
jgi:hypothetical protein